MLSYPSRLTAIVTALLCAGTLSMVQPAQAENAKIRLAYLRMDTILPILAARDAGEYQRAGIDLEVAEAQGGPAAVAALASGSADIGFSGSLPPINARLNGVPIRLVMGLGHEAPPNLLQTWFVASKASGISELKEARGRKIALNANGGLCELAWRDHLLSAGIKWSEVQPVVLPFPQMEAALQQGAVDAVCAINPFYSSIQHNPEIGAKDIAVGMLADLSSPALSDILFSTEDFADANADVLKTFGEVTGTAWTRLANDKEALAAAAEKYFDLTPEAARAVTLGPIQPGGKIERDEVQRLLDAMSRTGMLTTSVTADDLIGKSGN